jgi:hypothetical protein
MTGQSGQMRQATTAEVRLDEANQRVSPPRRSQLTGSTVCCARNARFIIAQAARRGDHGLTTTGNPGNISLSGQEIGGVEPLGESIVHRLEENNAHRYSE